MSFANINIGASAGDHGGDPIRTAFQKINNNFQQITDGTVDINVSAPVQSVAGRTGNVVLTANDIIGTVTQGQVLGLIEQSLAETSVSAFTNDANYANVTYVDSSVGVALSDLVGAAPAALNTLFEIANSLGNNASLSATLTNSIGAITSNVSALQSNVSGAQTNITSLQSNAASQQGLIVTNTNNITTLFANAATQSTELTNLWANAAAQKSSLDSNAADIVTLFANAATQKSSLDSLTANAATQQGLLVTNAADIVTLFANAATQKSSLDSNAADIVTLFANAAAQKSSLDSLTANAGAQSDAIASNSSNIVTLFANAATQNSSIVSLWANAAAQQAQIDSGASNITTLFTNAAAQHSSIGALESNVTAIQNTAPYTNSNVAAFLPTYTGNLTANLFSVGLNKTISGSSTVALINNNPHPAIESTGTLHIVSKENSTSQVVLDSIDDDNSPGYLLRRARGNLLYPSRITANSPIGSFTVKGYTPSGFTQSRGSGLIVWSTQDFTESAQASNVVIYTTRTDASTAVPHTRFESNGAVIINTGVLSTSPSSGALQVQGGAGVLGNVNISNTLNVLGTINTSSIATGPLVATGNIYANGIANDVWMWANGNPISFQYSDSDVATYLAATEIVVNGIKSDNWYWANSESITLGYNNTNVENYLAATDIAVNGIESDSYMWANSAPVNFVTYQAGGGISVGNISITERNIIATGGNAWPLTFDFPAATFEHNLTVTDELVVNSSTPSTTHDTGALVVNNGGLGVSGSAYVAADPASRLQVGEGGQILPDVKGQFTSNVDSYIQVNMQNLSNGPYASSDFVATADNGDDESYFIDMGIASSTYDYPGYSATSPNDGYLLVNGGNLLLNAGTGGKTIKFVVGGSDAEYIKGVWTESVLSLDTSVTTNYDVTAGGNVAGQYFNGNIVGTTGTITSIDSYTGYFASNVTTSFVAFGADPLARNAGLIGQVVDSLGFVTQYNNGVIMVNEQGSVEQNLFLGDTDVTSNATLLGLSVTNGGGYNRVLNLTGTGNLFVSNVYATVYGDVTYTPANVSNWDSSVTTVAEALDELAQRLRTAGF